MAKLDDFLNHEEDFFSNDRKEKRKERAISQAKDRSQYKKSDQDKKTEINKPLAKGLLRGRVLKLKAEAISVMCEDKTFLCSLKGSLKKDRTKQKNLIAVGDWVHVEPTLKEQGTIHYVEKRESFLARSDNLSRRKQQLIAVNIDQVFIVVSIIQPKFKPLLVDRYVIAAKNGNMAPIILINKIDLIKQSLEEKALLDEFLKAYKSLNIPVLLLSCNTGKNVKALKKMMLNKTSVFAGQSGVGKSSLINQTLGTDLPVGEVVTKTKKGSHTTTAAELISLEKGGFCIDTPGIKSFGIWDLTKEQIIENFSEFAPFAHLCKFPNCSHLHEPDCAVKQALEDDKISIVRYESYLTLIDDTPLKEWE